MTTFFHAMLVYIFMKKNPQEKYFGPNKCDLSVLFVKYQGKQSFKILTVKLNFVLEWLEYVTLMSLNRGRIAYWPE